MRNSAILLIVILLSFAQHFGRHGAKLPPPRRLSPATDGRPPVIYLGISGGINNPSGFPGVDIDVPVSPHISFAAGAGVSSWEYKLHLDAKYYLLPYNRGFAFGGGITYNTAGGDSGYVHALNTASGYTNIKELPQVCAFAAVYYYFNLGRAYNRFYIEAGWSQRLTKQLYGMPKGVQVDYSSFDLANLFTPGGPMLGGGFSFGVRRK